MRIFDQGTTVVRKIVDVYLDLPEKIQVIQLPKVFSWGVLKWQFTDLTWKAEGMSLEQLAFPLSKYNRKSEIIIV